MNSAILVLLIVPPFFLSLRYIKSISIKEPARTILNNDITFTGLSKELPRENPQDTGQAKYLATVNDRVDESKKGLESRFSSLINVQGVMRYDVFLQNSIFAELEYSTESNPSEEKNGSFGFEISCMGKEISPSTNDQLIKKSVRFDDEYVKILADCYYFPYGGIKNDTGEALRVFTDINDISVHGEISILAKPDIISKILIFLGWYTFWMGFIVLVREGPIYHLKRISK